MVGIVVLHSGKSGNSNKSCKSRNIGKCMFFRDVEINTNMTSKINEKLFHQGKRREDIRLMF